MHSDAHQLTQADRDIIAARLGRPPHDVIAVAARDAQGRPRVITNHPLRKEGNGWVPFPTLYWLIDPDLCTAMADLERKGAIGEFEKRIAADEDLRATLHADHRAYAAARWALLNEGEKQRAIDAGFAQTLRDKGIGGIACFDAIKCLHLHAAHHLAEQAAGRSGTTVGRLVEARLGVTF